MAKNEKKKSKLYFKIVSIILLIVSFILLFSLFYSNTLPTTYLVIIIIFVLLLNLILIMNMLRGKRKKITSLISMIFIFIISLLSFYIIKTAGILNNLNLNYKTYNYSVVVLKNSDYDKIADIKDKNLGFYETSGPECDKSLAKLEKKVETNNSSYDDYQKLSSDLLEEKVDAMLIENSYLDILDENDNETTTEETDNNDTTNINAIYGKCWWTTKRNNDIWKKQS